jgi:hypothetical protein
MAVYLYGWVSFWQAPTTYPVCAVGDHVVSFGPVTKLYPDGQAGVESAVQVPDGSEAFRRCRSPLECPEKVEIAEFAGIEFLPSPIPVHAQSARLKEAPKAMRVFIFQPPRKGRAALLYL